MVYVGSSCNGGLSEFNELIKFYNSNWNGSGFRYMDYGCYCGYDGKGYPIDQTDNCCLFHDQCWNKAEADFGITQNTIPVSYSAEYSYMILNGQVQCQNEKSFERALCECDKFVSICFRQSRSTYNPANRRLRGFNRNCKNRNIITNMNTLWTNYLYPGLVS